MRSVFKRNGVSLGRMAGHCAVVAALAAILSACSPFGEDATRGAPISRASLGGVAGDDPRSVLAARGALARGGAAADAAVAYFFMASVGYPSTSSLAAGGVCMNYDEGDNEAKLLDFRGAPLAAADAVAGRSTAVPGAVRGLFLLHAETGVLAWQDMVSPAERAARFGIPVSRALARDLALAGDALIEDPEARKIFARPPGGVLGEGDTLIQLDLAGVLSFIRTRGAGDFYVGHTARRFSQAVRAIGIPLAFEDMRGYAPAWRDTYRDSVEHGIVGAEATIHAPGPGFDSGSSALAAFGMLRDGGLVGAMADGSADHLAAEVALRAAVARALRPGAAPDPEFGGVLMADYAPSRATPLAALPAAPEALAENPATSSVVAVDAFGNAVACVFTMNRLFGNGRVAPGAGVLLSQAPGGARGDGLSLLPVIVVNEAAREVIFAGAVSGGAVSAPVMARAMAELTEAGAALQDAIDRPRVFHPGEPDVVVVEQAAGDAVTAGLAERGHEVRVAPELGRINAVFCPEGLRNGSESCAVATDPRAFGLAVGG